MSGLHRIFLCLLVTTSLPTSLATSIASDPHVAEQPEDTRYAGVEEEKEEADNPPSPPEE